MRIDHCDVFDWTRSSVFIWTRSPRVSLKIRFVLEHRLDTHGGPEVW